MLLGLPRSGAEIEAIPEYWRSGGSTGAPLFYPRSFADIAYAMVGFARIFDCTGCSRGARRRLRKGQGRGA
jgi:phenylacetate-coenzyme A ligase PaaK-like adenylate-forming protein